MPLFGPNIKKMKEGGDVEGLSALLKADNLQTQVEATEALLELGDTKGLQLINQRYSDVFKFGDKADKVELMIMMQGRYSEFDTNIGWLIPLELPEARILRIMKFEKVTFRTKPKLEVSRSILFEAATNSNENPLIRLLAVLTLTELGDRSDEVIQLIFSLLDELEDPNLWNVRETLRAISNFSHNREATDFLIRVQRGELFKGKAAEEVRQAAIYALGAIATSSAREYLEYLTGSGDKLYRQRAKIALGLFGKANYDEIKAKAG